MSILLWFFLLSVINICVHGERGLPFEVNSRETCPTQLSIDSRTVVGIARGDEDAPCSGYLMYTAEAKTLRLCADHETLFNDYTAQRACYTMGINYYRDTTVFELSKTRQMQLYRCFSYKEQNVDSVEKTETEIFRAVYHWFHDEDSACIDEAADPSASDCFDTCYFTNSNTGPPELLPENRCTNYYSYAYIGCSDINECVNGVRDNCTSPFDGGCTIRPACGNNTDCTNHVGSFECSCKNGFEYRSGDSFDPYDLDKGCIDVDECKESKCDINANCVNTIGSYSCSCREGFVGDGKTCTAMTCSALPSLMHAEYKYPISGFSFGDTVVCECEDGYKVSMQNLPETLVNYYGYSTTDSFTLTCDEKGDWGPNPMPQCIPVDCGDPGMIPDAKRDGMSFLFDQEVTYTCKDGYQPEKYGTVKYFTRKCQANGDWTEGSTCMDVNECQSVDICKEDQHCANTIGSYLCLDGVSDDCDEGYCKNGECQLENGKAECVCDEGYTGYRCETPTMSTALILSIVAIVLLGVLIIILCMACCSKSYRSPHLTPPNLAAPPQGAMKPHGVDGTRFTPNPYGYGRRPF